MGERPARYAVLGMIGAQYLLCSALVLAGSFRWPLLLVLINLPMLPRLLRVFEQSKPDLPPADYPPEVWPLWFSAHAFSHTRRFTSLFLAAVVLDTLLA
jgi:1,4-dihydroxy-2-naphthoate octaprenyltransferase